MDRLDTHRIDPYIDNGFVDSRATERIALINPATASHAMDITAGHPADAERAVASARQAFDDGRWSLQPPSFRKAAMHRWADLIEQAAADLDRRDAEDMGKPISVAYANAAGAAGLVRFYAEAIDKIAGNVLSSDQPTMALQRSVPRGVVAAIVPWNFPAFCVVLKAAPALAAGNTVVLKPSEMSSRSALVMARLATQAGVPAGVFNIVPGLGSTVGKTLALHNQVDMISFTGSTAVGKQILAYSAQSNMKQVMAECGGKSPQLVFADGVDLDAAAVNIAQLILTNQGQLCSTGSRLLVQRTIEEELLQRIAAVMENTPIGLPLDSSISYGPMASQRQFDRVISYLDGARGSQAQLVTGGNAINDFGEGYYIQPTLYRNVDPLAPLAQEEIFGPVLASTAFDTVEEAIALANGTRYGLAAYAWTADLATGMRIAKGIKSCVLINSGQPTGESTGHAFPIEPFGQSGFGIEGGLAGLYSYLHQQTVAFNFTV